MNMNSRQFKVLFLYPNLMLQTMFPMAITVLSSVLKRAGYEVDAFDTTFYETEDKSANECHVENLQIKPFDTQKQRSALQPLEAMIPDLRDKVDSFQPDLIAVSALEDTFHLGIALLEGIKDYHIPNVVGGVFPTFAPEKVIREPVVDIVCVGEGEGALLDLCDALSSGRDHTGISNLWAKRRNGDVVRNPVREPVDLATLPLPDFTLFKNERFYFPSRGSLIRMGSVETARGCPYRCSFCNSPAQVDLHKQATGASFFRLKPLAQVHQELRYLKDHYQVEYIHFPADTFLAMPDFHLAEFGDMYQDIKLPFWCQTRPETLTPERVRILEYMGCLNLAVGIEHGNAGFRREIVRRNYSNELLVECLNLLAGSSINVNVNNIVGLPTETRQLTWDSIHLSRQIGHVIHTTNAFHFVPYHGTPLRQLALKLGYLADDVRVQHNMKDTVLNMPKYPRDQIRGAVRTFTMYMRFPESEFGRIAIAEEMNERGDKMFQCLRQEFIDRFFREQTVTVSC
jgi:anaerobic magnesium-protoporphyrin IX monomethyl ester cyclase